MTDREITLSWCFFGILFFGKLFNIKTLIFKWTKNSVQSSKICWSQKSQFNCRQIELMDVDEQLPVLAEIWSAVPCITTDILLESRTVLLDNSSLSAFHMRRRDSSILSTVWRHKVPDSPSYRHTVCGKASWEVSLSSKLLSASIYPMQ